MKRMCTVLLSGLLISCLCIGCSNTNNAINESTDRLEKTIKEEESSGDTTIINNYNDNSTTNNNNTTNNYYNTDTDVEEETDDEYVVKVYVTEGRIVNDEESGSDYREYKDYSDNNNCDTDNNNCDNTITPIGDIKNDMDPDPNVVHIKNIKCPKCGAYSYIEHYNLKDENLTFYMGICNSCGYER